MQKLFIGIFMLIAGTGFFACTACYECGCESYVEVNGQVVDTTTANYQACGKTERTQYEDDGCVCTLI